MTPLDPRWWLLTIVGAALGAALGFAWATAEPTLPDVSPDRFRNEALALSAQESTRGEPVVRDVVVSPPVQDAYGKDVHAVRFTRLTQRIADGQPDARTFVTLAPVPFLDRGAAGNTVLDWLGARAAEDRPHLAPRFAWWLVPRTALLLGAGAGLLVAAVGVPLLVYALVGVGLAQPVAPREGSALAGLRGLGGKKKRAAQPGGKRERTSAELDALNAELEAKLAAGLKPGAARLDAPTEHHEPTVKVLRGDADPSSSTPAPQADDESKEFGGEYYPVVRPHHPKHDDAHPAPRGH